MPRCGHRVSPYRSISSISQRPIGVPSSAHSGTSMKTIETKMISHSMPPYKGVYPVLTTTFTKSHNLSCQLFGAVRAFRRREGNPYLHHLGACEGAGSSHRDDDTLWYAGLRTAQPTCARGRCCDGDGNAAVSWRHDPRV